MQKHEHYKNPCNFCKYNLFFVTVADTIINVVYKKRNLPWESIPKSLTLDNLPRATLRIYCSTEFATNGDNTTLRKIQINSVISTTQKSYPGHSSNTTNSLLCSFERLSLNYVYNIVNIEKEKQNGPRFDPWGTPDVPTYEVET